MIKLHYVTVGEQVEFAYLVSVIVEAKFRGCPTLVKVTVNIDAATDASRFNSIVDWLINKAPGEFCI